MSASLQDVYVYPEELASGPRHHSMMIYCSACGTLIGGDEAGDDSIHSTLMKRLHPQQYDPKQRPGANVIRCAAKEVENTAFDEHPWAWEAMYRLIVKDYDNGDGQGKCQYWLSGIGSLDDSMKISSFVVPQDRNAALFAWNWYHEIEEGLDYVYLAEDLQQTSYYYSAKEKGPPRKRQKHGYPVHARCWSLIEHLICRKEAEANLETLLEALRQQFQKQILEPPWYLDECGFPKISPKYDVPSIGLKAGFEYYYDFATWYLVQSDETWCKMQGGETRYLSRDPVRISEVECLLKGALLSPVSKEEETITKKYPGPFSVVIGLALEIQYLILDHLGRHDITMLHAAFSGQFEWRVSDSYWIQRAPRKLIYEIQDFITNLEEMTGAVVDWEDLCLQAEQLVQTSEQLRNRQRILDVLEGTRDIFYEMIHKD